MLRLGIDLGSATQKVVILDDSGNLIFKKYLRHNGEIRKNLLKTLYEIGTEYGVIRDFKVILTGTAGMGLASRINIPFVQEVIAISNAVKFLYCDVSSLIELGGEDAKIVLFNKNLPPEMRMNGSCAGGTGSFIDQMATLLNVNFEELNRLSAKSTKRLYIASRCGVFAKTDVQALINKGENKNDIAKAVFIAVANQVVSALLSGAELKPKILFAGGPLTFMPELRKAFIEIINLPESEFILADNSEVLVAIGAALIAGDKGQILNLNSLIGLIKNDEKKLTNTRTLQPLFKDEKEYQDFITRHKKFTVPLLSAHELENVKEIYMGIDAGSTTTKIVLLDEKERIIDTFYSSNLGTPLDTAIVGLKKLKKYLLPNLGPDNSDFKIGNSKFLGKLRAVFATGYGEEFVKTALNLDGGIVETAAHFAAGSLFNPDINFIVDIGGQDIKAIKIEKGIITDIQLNEACSSGTGSFISTFADNLGLTLEDFIKKALFAKNPVDLGTRCSVFMNSKVKEALKDGLSVDDIAAGLAYSVVKNALFKVIKIKSIEDLGEIIFVQGGTFKNDAVLKAFELLTGREVYRLNISEYMGAFGAALYAKKFIKSNPDYKTPFDINSIEKLKFNRKTFTCNGCGNKCLVTQFKFSTGNIFYSGNRCEKIFSNKTKKKIPGIHFFREKEELIFNPKKYFPSTTLPKTRCTYPTIGIPRVLSIYEHYPFFYTMFSYLGIKTLLSDFTSKETYYRGLKTVTADNICMPAKVANGHILQLLEKGVDRIFFPSIIFEKKEGKPAKNSFNCPVVTGYGEVLKRSIKTKIPIDSIPISFRYIRGIRHNIYQYLKEYGITKQEVKKAINAGFKAQKKSQILQQELAREVIDTAVKENKPLIVVLGRPYHMDPLINNGIMDMIYDLGAYAISENAIPELYRMSLKGILPLTQWSYHNRLYLAAKWVAQHPYKKIAVIQLNSFGCGPDAVVVDEVKTILESRGRIYTSIKIDEMSNQGAAKIRIRSILEALNQNKHFAYKPRQYIKPFNKKDKQKTLLVPYFSKFYSDFIEIVFKHLGYRIKTLTKQSKEAVEEGLKYVNNDMCYPAIVVIGDIIKAFKDKIVNPEKTVVALSQTGGQCRASNYVPILKKALIDAGYTKTPVVSLSTDSFSEGFTFNPIKLLKYSVILFAAGDAILRMKLKTKPYEINTGETNRLVNELIKEAKEIFGMKKPNKELLVQFVRHAINRFNRIEVNYNPQTVKKVGIVGEIYLKSNCFSNNYIVNWLEDHHYEVVMPTFLKFFEYGFYSQLHNKNNKINIWKTKLITGAITHYTIDHYRNIVERELKNFKRYEKEIPLSDMVKNNHLPLPLYIQFGEGWLLSAEITEMINQNIKDIISLQPFGCISNHIVAKGIYRYLRDKYNANLLLLDYESGTSEANILNRLELFLLNREIPSVITPATNQRENQQILSKT